MTQQWWGEPAAGDIVWCHFPDNIHPRPKPRPVLILTVFDDDAPHFEVRVAYGTSQKTTRLHGGEFAILRERNLAAYEATGLREAEIVDIPFLGALAGCSARRSERRVASHTSEEQRRNAPARAAKNGILAFSASLSYDTKFDLKQAIDLPYSTEWFVVPPVAPHGQTPKLGTLHPSLVRAVQAAFRVVSIGR